TAARTSGGSACCSSRWARTGTTTTTTTPPRPASAASGGSSTSDGRPFARCAPWAWPRSREPGRRAERLVSGQGLDLLEVMVVVLGQVEGEALDGALATLRMQARTRPRAMGQRAQERHEVLAPPPHLARHLHGIGLAVAQGLRDAVVVHHPED